MRSLASEETVKRDLLVAQCELAQWLGISQSKPKNLFLTPFYQPKNELKETNRLPLFKNPVFIEVL